MKGRAAELSYVSVETMRILPGMAVRMVHDSQDEGYRIALARADREETSGVIGIAAWTDDSGRIDVSGVHQSGHFGLREEQWAAVLEGGGPLIPGATYYLSDREYGKLTTSPHGMWRVQVGIALSERNFSLHIEPAELVLEGREVESVWSYRDERVHAIAVVFADGMHEIWESANIVSRSYVHAVVARDFKGRWVGIEREPVSVVTHGADSMRAFYRVHRLLVEGGGWLEVVVRCASTGNENPEGMSIPRFEVRRPHRSGVPFEAGRQWVEITDDAPYVRTAADSPSPA